MHPTVPESTEILVIKQDHGVWALCVRSCGRPHFPFPVYVVSYKMLSWNVLIFKTCSALSLFPHIYVSPFPLIILLLLFLARLLLALRCVYLLNSPYFLLIFVSLLKFPAPTAPLPSSAYPHPLCSLLILSFQPFFQLSPNLSLLWNNKLFPLSFPFTEDVFGPSPKNLWRGTIPMPLWVSTGHISRGVSSAWSLHTKSGLVLSTMFLTVRHSRQPALEVTGPVGLAPSGNSLMSSYHFSKKVCLGYENLNLLFITSENGIRWSEGMLSQQYWPSCNMFLSLWNNCIIQLLFILYRFNPAASELEGKLYLKLRVFYFGVKNIEVGRVILICPLMGN